MGTLNTNFDTTTNKYIFIKGLNKVWDSTARKALINWKDFFRAEDAGNRYIFDDLRYGGFSGMSQVVEGASIPVQDPNLGQTRRYTMKGFGTGFRITYFMKHFNKIELMQKNMASLRLAMDEGKDVEVAKIYNNATATTYGAGFDTYQLAYASHPVLKSGGSAYSNYPNAAMSLSALQDARYYFDTIVDDNGMIMGAQPDTIYYHPILATQVDELFKSDKRPWELSNTQNVLGKQIGWQPKPYYRLTSTTAWGVLAKDNDLFDVKVYTELEPATEVKDAPDTSKDTIVIAYQIFDYGFGDPRMVYVGK